MSRAAPKSTHSAACAREGEATTRCGHQAATQHLDRIEKEVNAQRVTVGRRLSANQHALKFASMASKKASDKTEHDAMVVYFIGIVVCGPISSGVRDCDITSWHGGQATSCREQATSCRAQGCLGDARLGTDLALLICQRNQSISIDWSGLLPCARAFLQTSLARCLFHCVPK